MRGHSRSKNDVASLAYDPRIHGEDRPTSGASRQLGMRLHAAWIAGSNLVKPGNDALRNDRAKQVQPAKLKTPPA
jgi:hypothetical protein